ncbi:hypothetical protein PR048_014293 [Dryococelus australis]|uniref:Peptidase aspartic putative domain-containing protein n=1 Tax=Dryococelus australis TaxID=614101 RepID=A0ABQ9HDS7_9NEOP|nr:hypothetical protein PR048_014293 [Dryococelus australis]
MKRQKLSIPQDELTHTPPTSAKGIASWITTPSRRKKPRLPIEALVLPQITSRVPSTFLKPDAWEHIIQLQLADPTFATPGEIVILLGAEIFLQLLTGKNVTAPLNPPGTPTTIDTLLGWELMGRIQINTDLQPGILSFLISNSCLPSHYHQLQNILLCEKMFIEGCTQLDTERYSTALPFESPESILGDSASSAQCRFHPLE